MRFRTLIYLLFAACLFFANRGTAQFVTYHFPAHDDSVITNVPLNEISTRAFRNFVKNYGFVPSATWRKGPGGFTVRFFSRDSVLHIVRYDPHGRLFEDLQYYSEENAPVDIRRSMARLYAGYSILFVNQLDDGGGKSIYDVGLTGNYQLRIVEIQKYGTMNMQVVNHYVAHP